MLFSLSSVMKPFTTSPQIQIAEECLENGCNVEDIDKVVGEFFLCYFMPTNGKYCSSTSWTFHDLFKKRYEKKDLRQWNTWKFLTILSMSSNNTKNNWRKINDTIRMSRKRSWSLWSLPSEALARFTLTKHLGILETPTETARENTSKYFIRHQTG